MGGWSDRKGGEHDSYASMVAANTAIDQADALRRQAESMERQEREARWERNSYSGGSDSDGIPNGAIALGVIILIVLAACSGCSGW